jgi:5-methyltetrahydrofolate--homocysteine methyltransferase
LTDTSAGIAMGAAAAVILFSSRSFILTLFATVSVGFVLTSVTAVLVGMGWTLGFIESILFAILIGISVDFVIHLTHAYASLQGKAPRDERTRFALISMGPSILAAAFTTFAAALVMLFTVVTVRINYQKKYFVGIFVVFTNPLALSISTFPVL